MKNNKILTGKLSNGIKYVISEDVLCNNNVIAINVNTGSWNEEKGEYGVSHLLEHLLFMNGKDKNKKELAQYLESNAINVNAHTGTHYTTFFIDFLMEDFEIACDGICDIAFLPKFSEDEINGERQIVLEELAQSYDNVNRRLTREFYKNLFNDNRRQLPIGIEDVIKNITKEEILNYYERTYTKDNIQVFVVGKNVLNSSDYLIEKLEEIIVPESKNLKNLTPPDTRVFLPINKKDISIEDELSNRLFQIYQFEIKNYSKNDLKKSIISELFRDMMSSGLSSIMFNELREKHKLCYSCNLTQFRLTDTDQVFFNVNVSTSNNKREKSKDVVVDLIKNVRDYLKEEDFTKAKKRYIKELLMSGLDCMDEISNMLRRYVRYGDYELNPVEYQKEVVGSVVFEDILNFINDFETEGFWFEYIGTQNEEGEFEHA